ncbi:MAG: sigma-70 family RNA polymerase sigma factor [Verrucomicrobiales bacterium]|nr:sigma-70 family RNA polymerase sigma factor [Verrucomicrobiales bacterium]
MDEPGMQVADLVTRTRNGDEAAASALVALLTPLVARIVRSHLPRRTSEEDLVQSVLIKVFTRLDQFRGLVPLEHWVARISVNTCRHEIARESHRPELRHADLSEEQCAVLENLAETDGELPVDHGMASRELVEQMLQQLRPEDRLVVTLLHLEGRSVEEIKAITGWSGPLVKVRAFRARRKMKQHLAQLMKEHRT